MPKRKASRKVHRSSSKLQRYELDEIDSDEEELEESLPLILTEQLEELMEDGNYSEAIKLFSTILAGEWIAIPNTWQLGAELVAKTAPHRLTEYLKAVHVNAPPDLLLPTFMAYIDQLMLEEEWKTAIDEIQLVHLKEPYRDAPDVRRKLAICSYKQWHALYQTRMKRDIDKDEYWDENDSQEAEYQRVASTTTHLLEAVHLSIRKDVEILDMYLKILDANGNTYEMKQVISDALKVLDKEEVDTYYVLYLMKINENDKYFSSKPYILFLYENVPYLDLNGNFEKYARYTCGRLVKAYTKNATTEVREKFAERAKRLFRIMIRRLEHCKFELWLLEELRQSLFVYVLDKDVYELYEEHRVYQLLRSVISNLEGEQKEVAQTIASDLELLIEEYELQSSQNPNQDSVLRLFEKVKSHPSFG